MQLLRSHGSIKRAKLSALRFEEHELLSPGSHQTNPPDHQARFGPIATGGCPCLGSW